MFIRTLTFLALALSVGCADRSEPLYDTADYAPVEIGVWGTADDVVGVIGFLNDPDTTFDLLDLSVGIDRRAASAIVDHRDGPDRIPGTDDDDLFDSMDEVDALNYVGQVALEKIFDFAVQDGWIGIGPDDFYGSWDGVEFTFAEAERVVEVANFADKQTLLEDVNLDIRAVASIVEARPISGVRELSMLYFVGESALNRLKNYASGDILLQDDPDGE